MCMGYSISKLVIVLVHVLKVKQTHSRKGLLKPNLPARPHNGRRKPRRIYSHPFVLRPRPSSAPSERSAVNIATQGSAKPPPWAEYCNRFAVEESHIADRCLTNHLSPFFAPGAVGDAGVVSICECTLSVQIKMLQSVTESDLPSSL
jgi:hypothetical protein